MNLLEFTRKFQTEEDCINHLLELRLKEGVTCKNCNEKTKHYWLESVMKFQCSVCRSRTNLKSGTIMENSKVPLLMWFTTIHFMTSTKKSFSALELQRQLGMDYYQKVWYMVMKVRRVMGKRDSLYNLKGDIEVDEGYFTTVNEPSNTKKDEIIGIKKKKQGRGTDKSKVMVLVESRPIEQNEEQEKKYQKKRVMGYVKMVRMDDLTCNGINFELGNMVDSNSTIYTDGYTGYNHITKVVKRHVKDVVKPKDGMIKLPWVHTIISNSKKMCLGVHHSVNKKYLQNYLDEFCYKLNRRNFKYRDNFDGLLFASSTMTIN